MPLAAFPPLFREHAFVWALVLSIVLHGALLLTKGFEFDRSPPADTLIIELQPVAEPPPAPPEPPKPKPQMPVAPKVKPQPMPAPEPQPAPAKAAPTQPAPTPEPAPQPAPQPEVVAVAPQTDVQPTFTAPPPPPEPPKVTGPSQQEIDAARASYARALGEAIQKHLKYPRLAEMRRMQGKVLVWVKQDENGNVVQSRIEKSSGFEVLDRQALETVKKASPLPLPPALLRNDTFALTVPVIFTLP